MVRGWKLHIAAVALAALPALAVPHERGDRERGVVEWITATEIAVKSADGHTVSFVITPATQFARAGVPVKREDVQAGERVVVEGRRARERLEAVRVKLGASPKTSAPR